MSLHHAFLCQSFNWRPEFLAKIFHFYYYQTRQTINFIISFNYISFMNSITRYYLMNIFFRLHHKTENTWKQENKPLPNEPNSTKAMNNKFNLICHSLQNGRRLNFSHFRQSSRVLISKGYPHPHAFMAHKAQKKKKLEKNKIKIHKHMDPWLESDMRTLQNNGRWFILALAQKLLAAPECVMCNGISWGSRGAKKLVVNPLQKSELRFVCMLFSEVLEPYNKKSSWKLFESQTKLNIEIKGKYRSINVHAISLIITRGTQFLTVKLNANPLSQRILLLKNQFINTSRILGDSLKPCEGRRDEILKVLGINEL